MALLVLYCLSHASTCRGQWTSFSNLVMAAEGIRQCHRLRFDFLWCCWLYSKKGIWPIKILCATYPKMALPEQRTTTEDQRWRNWKTGNFWSAWPENGGKNSFWLSVSNSYQNTASFLHTLQARHLTFKIMSSKLVKHIWNLTPCCTTAHKLV